MHTQNKTDLNASIEVIGFGFTLKEATELMYHEVMRKSEIGMKPTVEKVGVISGILNVNNEMEVIVQFLGGIEQFTKEELESQLTVLTRDKDRV